MNTQILSRALEHLLRRGSAGDLAFTRAFGRADIDQALAGGMNSVGDWNILAVGESSGQGWITADQAVEVRENKGPATFLLVDAHGAGAGMDGIYSAAREIDEKTLFKEAMSLVLKQRNERCWRDFADEAIKKARRLGGRRNSTSLRQEFEFLGRLEQEPSEGGRLVRLLGLWPVVGETAVECGQLLGQSAMMVEKLMMPPATSQAPVMRINSLVLSESSSEQITKLEEALRSLGSRPKADVLENIAKVSQLWLGNLRPAFLDSSLAQIIVLSWRRPNGKLLAWSGLEAEAEESLPLWKIDPESPKSKLEVRWKTIPDTLPKASVTYEVRVLAGTDVLAARQVEHSDNIEQKVIFTHEDFDLDPSSKLEATIEVSATTQRKVESEKTEDFVITFGTTVVTQRVSSGEVFRCMADGLIHAASTDEIGAFLDRRQKGEEANADKYGFVACRLPGLSRGFRVERPRLLQKVEDQWARAEPALGRWVIRCRADGFWTTDLKFEPLEDTGSEAWTRLLDVSRRFRDHTFKAAGIMSRFYLHGHSSATLAAEYINVWQAALETGSPQLALAHTVEVQNPGGRTTGLIVLPSHPVRVAWQSAYDDLACQMRFEEGSAPRRIRRTLTWLDGAHFPFVLPGLEPGSNFVFGDVLGLCAVAMVSDRDREPKSAIATLAACFSGDSERVVPGLSVNSGDALAREVGHYLDSHPECTVVRVLALQPGDGATVVRALGKALITKSTSEGEAEDGPRLRHVVYQLDLHPSEAQMSTAGAHLVKINQRRRAGVAGVPLEDAWSLESLSQGGARSLPRLRWARRDPHSLTEPAHFAIAFDAFASRVVSEERNTDVRPILSYGLAANLQRVFSLEGSQPCWRLFIPPDQDGIKLPNRVVTERLQKIQNAIASCVTRWFGAKNTYPLIRTVPSAEDVETLHTLHRLCDWVVTVDRNAGVEYFDSPRESPAPYNTYLIDAVPERDDLGCLQMITSTTHFDEVRHLLDQTLAMMGLSGSMRNCEYLLGQLKGLSGRLAMRLASSGEELAARRVGSELVALSLARAHCLKSGLDSHCWLPLSNGFLVPLDDVCDLVPANASDEEPNDSTGEATSADQPDSRRADLLFVSVAQKGRLQFRFAEIKYRRHLALARASALVDSVLEQTRSTRGRWQDWFFGSSLKPTERIIRAGRLVRALRFYADKSRRHYLDDAIYCRVCEELDRLLKDPCAYEPSLAERPDRAFIFCPDFTPATPEELFPGLVDDCRVWLFGPDTLPDISKHIDQDLDGLPSPSGRGNHLTLSPIVEVVSSDNSPGKQIGAPEKTDIALPLQPEQPYEAAIALGQTRDGQTVRWVPAISGNPHLMIAGLPGMGKTTCLINICRQLVKSEITPIIFSYHDDIDEKLSAIFPSLTRSDGRSLGFNPMRVTQDVPLGHVESAGQLRDIFTAIFPDLGDLQLEQLRGAIKQSYQEVGWGSETSQKLQLPTFRRFVDILRRQEKPDTRTQTLLARLAELDGFEFFRAEQGAESLLNRSELQILRVHACASEAVQRAYASFVLYSIYQDMFRRVRPNRITHAIIFDEAHRAAKLKLIPTMAKECRKYGIAMIVASQEAKDFDTSLFSGIANYLLLRVTDQDARTLARNVAPSEIERRTVDRLKTLPKFEALYFGESQRLPFHIHLESSE